MMIKKIGLSAIVMSSLAMNAQAYSQTNIDKVVENITAIQEDIDALYERADENEFQATMNRIKWGAEFETSVNNIDAKVSNKHYHDNNKWTTKLRLSMESKINDKTKFYGRLSMYKNWSDSSVAYLADSVEGRKPIGTSNLFVERAYVDYNLNNMFSVTLGRQPSSDGPGMTLIENTQRKSTYPAILFDGSADGVVATAKLASKSPMNPIVRVAYGKGFQSNTNFSPYKANQENIKDLNVYGAFYEMSLPFKAMGDTLLVLSYVHATDFIAHPQQITASSNKNLGDMDLAGIYFENNKAFGTKLSYFLSAGWNKPKENINNAILKDSTGNDMPAMGLIKESGSAFHIGARYDFDLGIKVGYEFNHGSKYWYSFTNGSSDLLNKLATRGDVNDIYTIYQMDINQFIKIGYTMIDYDYSGSGWHIGKPQITNDSVDRMYTTYNLRF